jgi:hypothetical protein
MSCWLTADLEYRTIRQSEWDDENAYDVEEDENLGGSSRVTVSGVDAQP